MLVRGQSRMIDVYPLYMTSSRLEQKRGLKDCFGDETRVSELTSENLGKQWKVELER